MKPRWIRCPTLTSMLLTLFIVPPSILFAADGAIVAWGSNEYEECVVLEPSRIPVRR